MEEDFLNIIISLEDYKNLCNYKQLRYYYPAINYRVEGCNITYIIPDNLVYLRTRVAVV